MDVFRIRRKRMPNRPLHSETAVDDQTPISKKMSLAKGAAAVPVRVGGVCYLGKGCA